MSPLELKTPENLTSLPDVLYFVTPLDMLKPSISTDENPLNAYNPLVSKAKAMLSLFFDIKTY